MDTTTPGWSTLQIVAELRTNWAHRRFLELLRYTFPARADLAIVSRVTGRTTYYIFDGFRRIELGAYWTPAAAA